MTLGNGQGRGDKNNNETMMAHLCHGYALPRCTFDPINARVRIMEFKDV